MGEMTADAAVYVQLLGSPRAWVGEREILFAPDKRYQLLAYLAYQGDWVSREKLAFLFWPDTDSQNAKQNLRGLLQRVRALEWLSGLEADAHQVRWSIETDVAQLRDALTKGGIEATLSLYRGPLLSGLEGDEEGEFGDWLAMERESLHGRWRTAVFSGARELETSKQHDASARLLHALIERDPLDEEGLQAYIHSAAQAGNKDQALSAYRAFAKHLQAELGMEPTSTTQQLAQEIERAASMPLPSRETVISVELVPVSKQTPPLTTATSLAPSLPKSATSFVGRDLELAEIMHLLSQEDCRLLTLTGTGGVGKTRLALQAAQELSRNYSDGVCSVPLDTLVSISSIPAALANVLGLELQGQEEPLTQVIRFLKDKRVLLVLDNFEHLLEGATIASELLQGCPNVKLLVTSRERLNLEEEWLLPVEGLSYPTSPCSLEKASAHDAVQLFVQRARKVRPSYTLTEEDVLPVTEMCELVGGSPLGIELAAAWVRALSVGEIAREIEQNLDFLSTTRRNVKERHASVRAAFEHSWGLLSAKEREVLHRLSVFRVGFNKEAASVVAGASVAVLAALLDKSLLRLTPDGRYDRHPLVYQYTQEKLAEDPKEEREVRERHGLFFLRALEEWNIAIRSGTPRPHPAPRADLENICAAWEWSVAEVRLRDIKRLSYWLMTYISHIMNNTRTVELLTGTLKALNEDDPEHRPVIGSVMVALAFSLLTLGDGERAKQLAERSIELRNPEVDNFEQHQIWLALMTIGNTASNRGEWSEAQSYYKRALTHAQRLVDVATGKATNRYVCLTLCALAGFRQNIGDYVQAEKYFQEARKLKAFDEAIDLNNYGELLFLTGRYNEAIQFFQKALRHARETGDRVEEIHSLSKLALTHSKIGEFDQTRAYCTQASRVATVISAGPPHYDVSQNFTDLGRAYTALSEYEQARGELRAALRFAWGCREIPRILYALVGIAELEAKRGCEERAARLLSASIHHPSHWRESRDLGRELLESLQHRLPKGRVIGEGGENEPVDLDRIVEDVLTWT